MDNKEIKTIGKQIDYNVLRQIEEHAKKYEEATDKKEFLKNVSAYEQKLILLNSKDPYEVLSYLDELDLKSSRIVLEELDYNEISKILELFSSEDKKSFYSNFSDLSLVNQFVIQDKNSEKYIKELPLERKVDLIESTKEETKEASLKVYESMPYEERSQVVENINSTEASVTISSSSEYKEDVKINEAIETNEFYYIDKSRIDKETLNKIEKEQKEEQLNQIKKEVIQKQEKTKEEILAPSEEQKEEQQEEVENEVIINSQQTSYHQIDNYEKYSIIGNGSSEASIVSNPKVNELFSQVKQNCEKAVIQKITQQNQKEIDLETKVL